MSEWWTYRLEDFLLFSEAVYWRQFELHNAALWPLQIPALLGGMAIITLLLLKLLRPESTLAPWRSRFLAMLLLGAWTLSGIGFVGGRYADINFAVADFTPLFVAQGLLLAILGWFGGRSERSAVPSWRGWAGEWIGIGLVFYGVVLHPFWALATGRTVLGAEVAGLTPDPTAVITLGVLVTGALGGTPVVRWLGCVVPILWLGVSAMTLFAMGAIEAVAPALAILLTLTALGFRTRR